MDRNYLEWLIAAGRREDARELVAEHLKTNPNDGEAWFQLADLVDDPKQKSECLKIAYEQGYKPTARVEEVAEPVEPQKRKSSAPLLLVLIAIACLMFYAISARGELNRRSPGGSSGAPVPVKSDSHTLTYRVEGTAKLVSLTYNNVGGDTEQKDATTPWMWSNKVRAGLFAYVSAQNQDDHGSVTCIIELDGKEVKRATSTGAYVIATCSGRVP